MMFERLERRAALAGAQAVARLRARLAGAVDMPDVAVAESEDGVLLTGPKLRRRAWRDPRLRWLGRLLR